MSEIKSNRAWREECEALLAEIARLKKIEAMAMACDGIDMGRHYEIPTEAWEALSSAVWDKTPNG